MKRMIGKDKPRRERTPINGGPRKRIAGDNDDDGGRRTEARERDETDEQNRKPEATI